jgi:GT2 family glycosyltransferase
MNKTLTVIVVTFNSEKYIERCLLSLLNSKTSGIDLKIVVVDNMSKDLSVSKVRTLMTVNPAVSIIENDANLGFAKAINLGINSSRNSDFYLLLNPDTVSNEETIGNLIQCALEEKAGIVGGSTYDEKGIQNGSYFRIPNLFVGIFDFTNFRKIIKSDYWHNYFYYLDSKSPKNACFPVGAVTGGFMLITRKTINKIGMLDERFFMYLEDMDFCLRAQKAGVKVIHTNESSIVHYAGRSSDNKDRIRHSSWLWSRKLYFLKNFNILENLIIQPIFLIDDLFILTKLYLSK